MTVIPPRQVRREGKWYKGLQLSSPTVKKFNLALSLSASLTDDQVDLALCHQCGQCTSICPSYRHGGIRTQEMVERASLGALDVKTDDSIWKCTMCNSCTERCQLGVDPAHLIVMLRNRAVLEGNIPDHYASEAKMLIKTGLAFPITGLTRKFREDMGLEELEVEESTLRELNTIIERTKIGGIDLE